MQGEGSKAEPGQGIVLGIKAGETRTSAACSNPVNLEPVARREQVATVVPGFVILFPSAAVATFVLGPLDGDVDSPCRDVSGRGLVSRNGAQGRDGIGGLRTGQNGAVGNGGQAGCREDKNVGEHDEVWWQVIVEDELNDEDADGDEDEDEDDFYS
jgi:hypothetical protein